ncbi:MAG TPA: hypothetical protein PLM07_04055 [Candidatus Rifleibacterium sp.]|nr:hypothetical protein [Candidatus Rifleibacterium sp.]HPT45059.1 hypothetical protein [Candidatus Rifleibacterium sp.]
MKKYKAKRLMQNGFRETLYVDRGKDGQFRVYAKIAGKRRIFRPLSRPWLIENSAQQYLDDYAAKNDLEELGTAVLG